MLDIPLHATSKHLISNCCSTDVATVSDICPDCKEHCGAIDENGNAYEFHVNRWILSKKDIEPNNGITYAIKDFLCIYKDGQLVAIEDENGHIERYIVERSSKHKSREIFDLNKAQTI